jgi:hypothetical protein
MSEPQQQPTGGDPVEEHADVVDAHSDYADPGEFSPADDAPDPGQG